MYVRLLARERKDESSTSSEGYKDQESQLKENNKREVKKIYQQPDEAAQKNINQIR
jgi:tRNA A37 N6-isopentenylltransferase MiaA